MRDRFHVLAFIVMVCLAPSIGQGQIFNTQATEKPPTFGSKNPQLKTLLELQYQMQLLKRLIEHERSVNQMVQAAIQIGLNDPLIPPPDQGICAQVPANIPCAQAYDDLYDNFTVAADTAPQLPLLPPDITHAAIPAPETLLETTPDAPVVAAVDLYWTDITCLARKCTAIISPDVTDPRARYRISPGETLPDGGVIDTISATGVAVKRNNTLIRLEPAPQA